MHHAGSFTAFDYGLAAVIAVLALFTLGAITHAVLKENGFGIVLNGVLLMLGVGGGVLGRALTIGFQ